MSDYLKRTPQELKGNKITPKNKGIRNDGTSYWNAVSGMY